MLTSSKSGLTVEQVTEIRKQCRENDAAYCVLKNRLVLRALNEVGITGLDDLLNGPNAFVFSMKDAVSGPKIINDYIEKNKLESLKITGGVLGTETLDVAAVKHLATLPSREVLLATPWRPSSAWWMQSASRRMARNNPRRCRMRLYAPAV